MLADRMRMSGGATGPMTVALTASPTNSASQTTYTFTSQSFGAAAATRDIVVLVNGRGFTARTISSATIGGVSAAVDASQGYTGIVVAAIRARVPSGTSGTIAITFSGACDLGCYCAVYRTEYSSQSLYDSDSATGASSAPSVTACSVPANGVIMAMGSWHSTGGNYTGVSWSGLSTEDVDRATINAANWQSAASEAFTSAGTPTITPTASGATTADSILLAVAYGN